MNDEDLRTVIRVLTRKLRKEDFQWVLEEYYETIQAGKVETKLAKYEHWNAEDEEYRVSGRPKKVTGTVPLTLEEQAALLISTIANAVVVPNKIAISLDRNIRKHFEDIIVPEIVFEPDLESVEKVGDLGDALPPKMKGSRVVFRIEKEKNLKVRKLEKLCEQLREAILR
jgi:hypothetical protein